MVFYVFSKTRHMKVVLIQRTEECKASSRHMKLRNVLTLYNDAPTRYILFLYNIAYFILCPKLF